MNSKFLLIKGLFLLTLIIHVDSSFAEYPLKLGERGQQFGCVGYLIEDQIPQDQIVEDILAKNLERFQEDQERFQGANLEVYRNFQIEGIEGGTWELLEHIEKNYDPQNNSYYAEEKDDGSTGTSTGGSSSMLLFKYGREEGLPVNCDNFKNYLKQNVGFLPLPQDQIVEDILPKNFKQFRGANVEVYRNFQIEGIEGIEGGTWELLEHIEKNYDPQNNSYYAEEKEVGSIGTSTGGSSF